MTDKPIARRLADRLVRSRWVVVAVWAAVVVGLVVLVRPVDPTKHSVASYLPGDLPSERALGELARYFPHNSSPSEAVAVFERRAGANATGATRPDGRVALTEADLAAIGRIADRLETPVPGVSTAVDLEGVYIRSPLSVPDSPMISPATKAGQAALITVTIPADFITLRSARIVHHVRWVVHHEKLPAGLTVAVTGSGAYGLDYVTAAERSNERSLLVTLTAVVLILLLVYRAPIAAVIPLAAISMAAIVALKLMEVLGHLGLQTGTAERIFVVVLLYGAGVDYSLLLMSRCREFMDEYGQSRRATAAGLEASLPAVLASAGTDMAGLLMLVFARYGIFRTTGVTVAMALFVAMLSAVTLVPALVSVSGAKLFWPGWHANRPKRHRLWTRIARIVTRRPGLVMVVTIAALAVPAVRGSRLNWVYDTLSALSNDYGAARGREMVKRHWPVGEIGPTDVLICADAPLTLRQWQQVDRTVVRQVCKVAAVRNVRSLTQPLGATAVTRPGKPNAVIKAFERFIVKPLDRVLGPDSPLLQDRIRREYVSADDRAIRMEIVLAYEGQSLQAMAAVGPIRQAVTDALAKARAELPRARAAASRPAHEVRLEPYVTGLAAQTLDKRTVTHGDFHRIAALVLSVIFVMVVVLLRDVILSAFMVATTVFSYLATLGISYWFCHYVLGSVGLDWKVEVFLFVVMVAVGQDYNIFLAARLAQEAVHHPCVRATRRAVIHTGPVISSCGLIMAGTLGSLMAGFDLLLLVQLGFALALGMLIDTFVVRPLLLPAFVVLTGRTGKSFRLQG